MDAASAKTERMARAAFDAYAGMGMPSESTVSFPVPGPAGARLEAHVFVAASRPTRDGRNVQLFRPTTRVRIDWESERVLAVHPPAALVAYERAGLVLPAASAVEPTEESDQRAWEARHGLYLLLDEVVPAYGSGRDEPELRGRCRDAFRQVVSDDARSLYEELNADFVRWLEQRTAPPPPADVGGWTPTHEVPPGGMRAWSAPDPAGPVVATLGAGLPLQVADVAGAWVRVIASNGWTAWVDGRLLRRRT
jgi:hypothetical protein